MSRSVVGMCVDNRNLFVVHDHTSVVHDDEYEEDVDAYTNHDVVERAFAVSCLRLMLYI